MSIFAYSFFYTKYVMQSLYLQGPFYKHSSHFFHFLSHSPHFSFTFPLWIPQFWLKVSAFIFWDVFIQQKILTL